MAKAKKKKYTAGTFWFLAIFVVSILGTFLPNTTIIWLILGISGAIVAYENIQRKEETSFLIAISSMIIIIVMFLSFPSFCGYEIPIANDFLLNLGVAFGVAGFVVSLGLITRVGLEK
ncbi:MAG: hypothetical protein JW700_02035 [Candidatus Aenigmarchaeota archaeon]|nr:hypothetical protein [Candidatus Aenigmarchaeota archaeon]